ncbi:hypothetical protein ACFPRL_29960 [Pseudoclavibacter helvolus]
MPSSRTRRRIRSVMVLTAMLTPSACRKAKTPAEVIHRPREPKF